MVTPVLISAEDLKAIPFFDAAAWAPERALSCLNFYVKSEWHCWIAAGDKLHKMKMWPREADYFGDAPERHTDQSFRLLHLMAQRASFPEMDRASIGIWNDFQNLAASLAKIRLFFETSKATKLKTSRFVKTEIEYILIVCRSVFDLLQEIIAFLWDKIKLIDNSTKKIKLPKSFADVLYSSNQLRSGAEISSRFGLPSIFADWYVSQAPFFATIRTLRNYIEHGGSSPVDALFVTPQGYAIQRPPSLWSEFYNWPVSAELPNHLVPLRPLLCAIIRNVISATDSFATVLEQSIVLPKPLFPNLLFFSRGYHDRELHEIDAVLQFSWWCDTHHPNPGGNTAAPSVEEHARDETSPDSEQSTFVPNS